MNLHNLSDFIKGWIIGDFKPSIIRTKEFEFLVRMYKKGDREANHVHRKADEITVVVSGIFEMNNHELRSGDIVHLKPCEPASFECIEDGATAVIKTPSVIGDKYLL